MPMWPPYLADHGAIDEVLCLLPEYAAVGLHMELYWREEQQEWECHFVTDSDTHYEASFHSAGKAIFDAIEKARDNLVMPLPDS